MKYTMMKTLKEQLIRIKKAKRYDLYFVYVIIAIFGGLTPVIGVFFTKIIIDAITNASNVNDFIIKIIILTALCAVCLIISSVLSGYLSSSFLHLRQKEFEIDINLYHRTKYENIENPVFQDKLKTALDAIGGDGMGFQKTYENIGLILVSLVSIILFCIIIGKFNILIVLVCIISTIVSTLINRLVANYHQKRQVDLAHANRQKSYFNTTGSDFSYGKDIRVFSLQNIFMDKYNNKSLSYIKVLKDLANKEFLYGLIGLLTLILQDSVAYILIILSAINKQIDLASVSLYISCIVAFSTVLRTLTDQITDLVKNLKITSYYFEFLDETEKEPTLDKFPFDKHLGLTIEFKNVWFKYPGTEKYVLKDLNLKIEANSKVAIVGTNGAGKTTIVKLISGLFEPTEGDIYINGVNLKTIDKKDYQEAISTVFQDYEIYAMSVIDNVGGYNCDRELAIKCIESVGLKEEIEALPNSYDTELLKVLDENGVDLSGGQKQKIAIARALYKNGGIVILDEPTAALDALAEASIYSSFANLVENKTAIYISHRLSSTKFCDKIAFFNQDGLQEYGTHDELMNNKAGYYEMFKIQGKYYQEGGNNNEE